LLKGPGHWPGTPPPGEPGNSVISGHRSTETRPFLHLDRLSKGDVISLTHAGRRYRYAVQFVTVVPEERYVRFVLKQPIGPRARTVTLFAMQPGDRSLPTNRRPRSCGRERWNRLTPAGHAYVSPPIPT
jgi:sortase A